MTTKKIEEEKERWDAVRQVGVANTRITELEAVVSARDTMIEKLQMDISQVWKNSVVP